MRCKVGVAKRRPRRERLECGLDSQISRGADFEIAEKGGGLERGLAADLLEEAKRLIDDASPSAVEDVSDFHFRIFAENR